MQYTGIEADGQLVFTNTTDFLKIPSGLLGFHNAQTTTHTAISGRTVYRFEGDLTVTESERICPECNHQMHLNGGPDITLKHLPFGSALSVVQLKHNQFRCPHCGATPLQNIPFKVENHLMTRELYQYARDLLGFGTYTLKDVAALTGLNKNVVKKIDKKRLQEKYTLDGKHLKKPEQYASFLGIDEFKLHDGHRYATHIIDMETGHVLWIGHGKKKQIVYDFIDHVGMDWMENVEAIACDMNSDFQEAFEERCEWIQPVFDYFHIVKNFNEKVIGEVRKDEQRRLIEEGDEEGARALKRTKYILTSSRKTLQRKDEEAAKGKVLSKGSELFNKEEVIRKGGHEARYDELLEQNKLLFTVDLVKEKLANAYRMTDEAAMAREMSEIMDICQETDNKHFQWFARLIDNHFSGIIAHATYRISAGKIEGINNKIKTLRRQGYGYPDDEYFFLKIIDFSRNNYVRNPLSHKFRD